VASAEPTTLDVYGEWLGIPPGPRPPDYYALLGVNRFESDLEQIEWAANERIRRIRPRCLKYPAAGTELLNEISRARICLLDATERERYDRRLAGEPEPGQCLELGTVIVDDETLKLVPESVARELVVLPLAVAEGVLTVAAREPDNYDFVEKLQFVSGRPVRSVAAPEAAIVAAIDRLYGCAAATAADDVVQDLVESDFAIDHGLMDSLEEEHANEPPRSVYARLLHVIVGDALAAGASAVSIVPDDTGIDISMRTGGELRRHSTPPRRMLDPLLLELRGASTPGHEPAATLAFQGIATRCTFEQTAHGPAASIALLFQQEHDRAAGPAVSGGGATRQRRYCPHCGRRLLPRQTSCSECFRSPPFSWTFPPCPSCHATLSPWAMVCLRCKADFSVGRHACQPDRVDWPERTPPIS
jgi:hypothetical protein